MHRIGKRRSINRATATAFSVGFSHIRAKSTLNNNFTIFSLYLSFASYTDSAGSEMFEYLLAQEPLKLGMGVKTKVCNDLNYSYWKFSSPADNVAPP